MINDSNQIQWIAVLIKLIILNPTIHPMIRIATLLIFFTIISCKDTEKEPDLNVRIQNLATEITNMTEPNGCATKAENCRLKALLCGGAFVYNVSEVDTNKLFSKFSELQNLLSQHETASYTCDIVAPDSTFIQDCKCVWGYKKR